QMNTSNDRAVNRYDHEEIVYEDYDDEFDLPFNVQRGQKRKETGQPGRTKQYVANRFFQPMLKMPKVEMEFKRRRSNGVIVDEDGDEEEDVYEEMEEDEDALYETGIVDDTRGLIYHSPDVIDKASDPFGFSRCLSCGRGYTHKYRLFPWPASDEIRRKWCQILELNFDKIHLSLDSSFLCASHFNPRDFICSADFTQIIWRSQAKPKSPHFIRNSRLDVPEVYEWEKHYRLPIHHPKPKLKPEDFIIKFRNSKYKVTNTSKTLHPVAIISSTAKPQFQYEFSYTRTSAIDGTKFYSCLHCRKAKTETGDKDNIRTIHLSGSKLLSVGDPLTGHHHACTPIYINPRMDEMEMEDRYGRNERDERGEHMDIHKKHHRLLAGVMEGREKKKEKNGMRAGQRIVYVDDSRAFASGSGAVVEVETSDGLWTTAEDGMSTVPHDTVDGHHSNMDDLLLDDPSTSHNWMDYSKMENSMREWKDDGEGERRERRETRSIQNRIKKKYSNRRIPYSLVSLSCPICTYRFPSTSSLIEHLQHHENRGGLCGVCGGRIDPALPLSVRRSGLCGLCKFHN
ncbi:hypothetical protein PENTCL1PPCAC_11688, partial [Pristionchus entomophagus]